MTLREYLGDGFGAKNLNCTWMNPNFEIWEISTKFLNSELMHHKELMSRIAELEKENFKLKRDKHRSVNENIEFIKARKKVERLSEFIYMLKAMSKPMLSIQEMEDILKKIDGFVVGDLYRPCERHKTVAIDDPQGGIEEQLTPKYTERFSSKLKLLLNMKSNNAKEFNTISKMINALENTERATIDLIKRFMNGK